MKHFLPILPVIMLLLCSCSRDDSDIYDQFYQLGVESLEAGDQEKAIEAFISAGEHRAMEEDKSTMFFMYFAFVFIILSVFYSLKETQKKLVSSTQEKVLLQIEKERVEKLYADAIIERDALSKMAESMAPDQELKGVIKQRLALLNKVIASYITDSSAANKEANAQIEMLVSNRDAFLESTRKSFEAGHPRFMAYLRSCGLSDWEVNYCCLYLVGLNGKEIGEYINLKRHYTYGSVIRQKLGLGEHDRNLANHLKNLLEDPPASNSQVAMSNS